MRARMQSRVLPGGSGPAFALLLSCLVPTGRLAAQSVEDSPTFHWAYAATLGTGIYRLGDDTQILVLKAPIAWTLREPDESDTSRFGIRLLFPITAGVEKFDLADAIAGDFPERVEQLSFLPGVELEFPVNERLRLKVRSQLGWGSQLGSGDDSALIYSLGIRSRLAWPDVAAKPAWISGVLWSGYDPKLGPRDSLAKLTNGVEFDIPISGWQFRGHRMHLLPHLLGDWYFDTADFFSFDDEVLQQLDWEWEMGLSASRDRPFSIFKREFERVGFALRFSDDSSGIRFFISSLF